MLMDETIAAFQEWLAVRKQKGYRCKYLFCSDNDEQMREENVPKAFKRALKKAGENINIMFLYMNSWINGNGCVPINNLMEDAATAEI